MSGAGMAVTTSDLDRAIQLLKTKQNAYYIEAVKNAMEAEQTRHQKLAKVTTHLESKRLEKQFQKERRKEKERLQQIQEDHQLLLAAKIQEWKANGVSLPIEQTTSRSEAVGSYATQHNADGTARHDNEKASVPRHKLSKVTLNRLATPRMTIVKATEGNRPPSATSTRAHAETSQELAFYKDIYKKHDRSRLQRTTSLPALNANTLKAMTATDLLQTKMQLLTQLHGVLSQQEKILQDDQCTIRSSVSSWKSADYKSMASR